VDLRKIKPTSKWPATTFAGARYGQPPAQPITAPPHRKALRTDA
jgi:hypothetical protein